MLEQTPITRLSALPCDIQEEPSQFVGRKKSAEVDRMSDQPTFPTYARSASQM